MVVMPAELKSHTKSERICTEDGRFNGYNRMDDNQNIISEDSDSKSAEHLSGCLFDLDQRFFRTACNLVGYVFRVKTSEGRIFEGILESFDPNFDVALSLAHEIQEGCEDDLPYEAIIKEKMIFSRKNIVTLSAIVDAETFTVQKSFATDSEIGRLNGGATPRDLEAWVPDGHADEEDFVDCEDGVAEGWTAEEMFERNKTTFGVVSTFKDNLTQFSNVQIEVDKSSTEYRAKLEHAERLAQAIMANPASQMAAALENDDEERDIAQRGASVTSSAAAATPAAAPPPLSSSQATPPPPAAKALASTPTSPSSPAPAAGTVKPAGAGQTTPDNASKVYIPPNKRKPGPNQNRFSKPAGPFTRNDYVTSNRTPPQQPPAPQTGQSSSSSSTTPRPNKVGSGGAGSMDDFSGPPPSTQQPHQSSSGYHGGGQPGAGAGSGAGTGSTATGAIPSAVYSRSRYLPHALGGGQQPQSPMQYQPSNEWDKRNQAPYGKRGPNPNSPGNYSKPPYNSPQPPLSDNSNPANVKRYQQKGPRDRDQNLADLRKFSNDFQLAPPPSGAGLAVPPPPSATTTTTPVQSSTPMVYSHPPPPPQPQQQRRPSPPGGASPTAPAPAMTAPPPAPAPASGGYNKQRSPPRNQQQQHHPPNQPAKFKSHNEPPPAQMTQRFAATVPPPPTQPTPRPQTLSAGGAVNVAAQPPPSPAATQSVGGESNAATATMPPAATTASQPSAVKTEMSESTLKSKLNPEAKEFCPSSAHAQSFYRPTPVQTPVGAPGGMAYPVAVQSPGSQLSILMAHPPQPMTLPYPPQQSSSPQLPPGGGNGAGNGDYGNGNGATVIYQAMMGAGQGPAGVPHNAAGTALYPQPPPLTGPPPMPTISSYSTLPLLSGTSPVYTINAVNQPALAILHSNNGAAAALRPYKVTTAGGQQATVANAGAQPIIATTPFPGNAGGPFLVQYPNAALQQGGIPQAQAFQPAQYFISAAPRMQYVLPQGAVPPGGDGGQQQVYTVTHGPSASNAVAQPVMTAPYTPGQPYVLQYAAVPSQLVLGQAPQGALAYQPSPCVFGAQRMPYLLPQQPGQPVENSQQQVYAIASIPQAGYPPMMRSSSVTGCIGPSATPGNHSNA